jgi:hypothetical protein
VGAQVVHDQHGIGLTLAQPWQQHRFEIGCEDGAVGRSLHAYRGDDTVHPEGAEHAQPLPGPEGEAGPRPLTTWTATIPASHVGQHAAFIEKDQPLWCNRANPGGVCPP